MCFIELFPLSKKDRGLSLAHHVEIVLIYKYIMTQTQPAGEYGAEHKTVAATLSSWATRPKEKAP